MLLVSFYVRVKPTTAAGYYELENVSIRDQSGKVDMESTLAHEALCTL
jgi:hypothetical protein